MDSFHSAASKKNHCKKNNFFCAQRQKNNREKHRMKKNVVKLKGLIRRNDAIESISIGNYPWANTHASETIALAYSERATLLAHNL